MTDQSLDIVFAAPHPDDLEILCGGTIALMVEQGYRVGMIHLTDGEPTPHGSPEDRKAEREAAAQVLGVQVAETLSLTNRELMDGPLARYALATVLRRYQPKILVGMAGRTPAASPDHYQGQLIDHLIYRPTAIAAERLHFQSQFVVDITSTMEKKIEAIKCYDSQFTGQRFDRLAHFVKSLAGTEGGQCGYHYGELYALPRPLGVKDPIATLGHWELPPPFHPREDTPGSEAVV